MTTTVEHSQPAPMQAALTEHVVLVDERGAPARTVPKVDAHHRGTELHLAFSCQIVRSDGAVLLTRRASSKPTWPGSWTNGCCGHPQVGETLREAVIRRLHEELGLVPTSLALAISDFAYRATMPDGTREHELCPVLIACVTGTLRADPAEVDATEWIAWEDLVHRTRQAPGSLSPWCEEQVRQLADAGVVPAEWAARPPLAAQVGLDRPIELPPLPPARPVIATPPQQHGIDAMAAIAGPLQSILDGFLDVKECELAAIDPTLAAVAEEIRSLVDAGGKRLRPAFAYWGHRATGGIHDPAVLVPAAAIELLHTFALVHDDVMDRSVTRRGRPSAFAAMADRHRAAGDLGDAEWFGTSAAMLAGDLAFVWADEMFDSCSLDPGRLARARRVFTTLRTEVIAGQYLDLTLAGDPGAAEGAARRVALLKSARYTVTRPLLLGAALGPEPGRSDVDAALTAYGDAVGLAFQMRDDVLGVFGDPVTTGKSRLDDLREGKRTVLALRALRLSGATDRSLLAACLGRPDLDDHDAARCREVIAKSGALASVEALLSMQHQIALAAIAGIDEPARTALEQLAASAIERRC